MNCVALVLYCCYPLDFIAEDTFMKKENFARIEYELKNPENIDCMGVTFVNGKVVEVKCYRYDNKLGDKMIDNFTTAENEDTCRKYYRVRPGVKEDFENILSNIVDVKMVNIPLSNIIKICNIAEKSKNALRIRLTQIGLQNIKAQNEMLKVYYSLRKFMYDTDFKGDKQSLNQMEDILFEIREACDWPDPFFSMTEYLGKMVENLGYYPSMLGVNQSSTETEYKIYFELFTPDIYFENIEKHSLEAISKICEVIDCSVEEFQRTDSIFRAFSFFMRGMAFSNKSVNGNPVIRVYYAPMKKFIL